MSEHDEQVGLFNWLKEAEIAYPDLRYAFAIPNGAALAARTSGGKRFSLQAMKLKAEGLKPGVPDLFIPIPRPPYHGLFIEMKFGRNKASEEQLDFLTGLKSLGYRTCICWSEVEAVNEVCSYLGIGQ